MAKLFASEVAREPRSTPSDPRRLRLHHRIDVERYFRDAPLFIVGEGTNEILRTVIAAPLVSRGGIRRSPAREAEAMAVTQVLGSGGGCNTS